MTKVIPQVGDKVELVLDGSTGTLEAIQEAAGVTWYHVKLDYSNLNKKYDKIAQTGTDLVRLQEHEFKVRKVSYE